MLTVSERTRSDLIRLYDLPPEKVVVTPNSVDPVFTPGSPLTIGTYVLVVGRRAAAQEPDRGARGGGRRAAAARRRGPGQGRGARGRAARRGADLRGYVPQEELVELYRGAACLVQPSRFEGFGLPVLEAMACGTPVVALDEPALREVAGDAAIFVDEEHLADGVLRAIEEKERLAAAGLERVQSFSWRTTAERTLAVYLEALG